MADILHSITTTGGVFQNTADAGHVKVTVAATDTPGVLILQPQGEASVSTAGQTYSYQMLLTQAPTAPVFVHILNDGQTFATTTDPLLLGNPARFDALNQTVEFDASNWNVPVTITLNANPNYVQPSDPSQASTTVMTFPNQPHTLSQIQGPLFIEGGVGNVDRSLAAAVALPYETNNPPVIEPTTSGPSNAIDIMKVYDDGAGGSTQTPQTGTLTSSTITGLDLLPGVVINYADLQTAQVLLGTGDDHFTVTSTDDSTMTIIEGGGGSNTITVTGSTGPLVIYGSESASGAEYSSAPGTINGTAYSFTNFGTDTIDASGATGITVIVGGPKHDDLTGGSGINWIAGGEGDDTIIASGTANYIFGDSSFTVDPLTRLMTIDNGLLSMDDGVLIGRHRYHYGDRQRQQHRLRRLRHRGHRGSGERRGRPVQQPGSARSSRRWLPPIRRWAETTRSPSATTM